MNLWERMPNESDQAWGAFVIFRDMGIGRTNVAVKEALGKSRTLINDWSYKNRWHERAAAFDNWLDQQSLKQAITIRETSRAEFEQAINRNLSGRMLVVGQLIDAEIRAMRDAQERGEPLDVMRLKRLISSIGECDVALRRSASLPTSLRSSTVEQKDDDQNTYFIGDNSL